LFAKIKRLGSETAIYGISTILGRFLTFFLTPFYTHLLSREDLGVVATVYAYIALLNVVYGYGMESAYMKYVSTLEIGDRRQVFSVPFLSVLSTSVVLTGVLMLFAPTIGVWAAVPPQFAGVVYYAAAILALDAIVLVPFAALRMERRPRKFAFIKLTNIVVNVACNLILLLKFRMGVEGIFISGVAASAVTVVQLLPFIRERITLHFPKGLYKALLHFGLPYLPAGLAGMMIQVVNRPIIESLSGLAAAGVFQASYRLGIFMMLLVSMFDFAWRPFFLSHASEPDAKPLFARVMTYFVLAMTGVFLFLTFFLGDIVRMPIFWGRSLFAPAFWSGLSIVPMVMLGYMFLGVYNNLVAGVYIQKKTQYLPGITIAGALINIGSCYMLIPLFGLMGAAYATLISYAVMAIVLYVVVQRIYPVEYELSRIAKIAVAAAAVYALAFLFDGGTAGVFWRVFLLGMFVVLMYALRFFLPSEMQGLVKLVRR
jgi:O-antigen/teichoic acid export membrane protein